MHDPKVIQIAFNAETRDHWDAFAGHRAKVTGLLTSGGLPGASRLCVLGAGNCNDVDLAALLRAHREVHLVDVRLPAIMPPKRSTCIGPPGAATPPPTE